jgi:hypothetical protein
MAFDAGTILGHLKLDRSGFTAGMMEAQALTGALGSTISAFLANPLAGVAMVAKEAATAIVDLVTGTAEAGEEIGKLSRATGASVEFLSTLKHAAYMTEVNFDSLKMGFQRLFRSASEAKSGTGPAAEAFKALGVAVVGADGHVRPTEQLFLDVADAISKVSNEAERTSLVQDIFGRGSGSLLELLGKGKAGIQELQASARASGNEMSGSMVAAMEKFNDQIKQIKSELGGLALQAGAELVKELVPVIQSLSTLLREMQPTLLLLERSGLIKFATAPIAIWGQVGTALGLAIDEPNASSANTTSPVVTTGPITVNVSGDPEVIGQKISSSLSVAVGRSLRQHTRDTAVVVEKRFDADGHVNGMARR